jgi:hypothetical protein
MLFSLHSLLIAFYRFMGWLGSAFSLCLYSLCLLLGFLLVMGFLVLGLMLSRIDSCEVLDARLGKDAPF